jgi:hypothetical protein
VTPIHTAPYTVGRVNVTCYTLDQLLSLARRGGLFARHLVDEALPLVDPQDVLGDLKSVYVHPLGGMDVDNRVKASQPICKT